MRVTVIGEGERAEARRAWYRYAGAELTPSRTDISVNNSTADIYDICSDPDERQPFLGFLLRQRHAGILLAGRVAGSAEAAARLVAAARRRGGGIAVTGGTRFVPVFARLWEFVSGGILGTVREVRIRLVTAPALAAEALPAGMDLGLWLAGDAVPTAASSGPERTSFLAGPAHIVVESAVATAQEGASWQVDLAADLGLAAAQAQTHPGLPACECHGQGLAVTLAGRQRRVEVPGADPAGNELAAILARQAAGLPWLGVCTAERAAGLLAVQEEGARKVCTARAGSS